MMGNVICVFRSIYRLTNHPIQRVTLSRIKFILLFTAACFFVFAYPVWRFSHWAGESWQVGWPGVLLVWIAGFLGMQYSFAGPRLAVRYLVVHWMGISFVFACVALAWEVLRLLVPIGDARAAPWLFLTALILVMVAMMASHHLQIRQFQIRSDKLVKSLRVVQISDVHIGSRQGRFMTRIVNRINALEPDFVLITGDLIDSSAVEIDALRSLENLTGTTYFSVGNHERYADLPKAIAMLESLGVIPLRQESRIAHGVQFIGIDDAEHHGQVNRHLPDVGVRQDHFTILLYHRPLGWESAVRHGVDLMLSGHTHNGQIFPFNWIVRQQFNRIRGLHRDADCHLYVSVGTGTWGPLMRLGSLNEISCFDLLPPEAPLTANRSIRPKA